MKELKKVKVNFEEQEATVEVLADSIKEISDGIKKLRSGKLNEKALIFLIHKSSGVAGDTVLRVLNGMKDLEKEFLK